MPQYEIITVTGRLGKQPEEMKTKDGRTFGAKFSIAVSHRQKNKETGEWETRSTNWWNVACFGDAGKDIMSRGLNKGDIVSVTSKELEARAYINRQGEAAVDLQIKVWDGANITAVETDKKKPTTQVDTPKVESLRDDADFNEQMGLNFDDLPVTGNDVTIPF